MIPARFALRLPCLGVLLLGLVPMARAYKEVAPPEKVELPAAKSPADSLAAIQVPEGYEVRLAAAEPLVRDPIDLAWGPDGRMWVVEMADYPTGLGPEGRPGGRIRVLSSSHSDGLYDQSTLFADGLRYPTSVLPWRGGVLVTSVPDLLFLEDTDGDGRADRRTVVLTGLRVGNPQHLANSLQWGLDGWVYLANGDSGGKVTTSRVTAAVELGRRDFRIGPDDGRVELLQGQTQAGRTRDDWGSWFGCNNSNPLWHYALDDRYLRRNPHLVPPPAIVSIGARPGAAPVFPVSRTLARFNDPHGRNHFTSACGLSLYRDDWLGAGWNGTALVCEPVHNLVHREQLSPDGATFRGRRVAGEEEREFLASADPWSRFTAAKAGPDGALYLVDMYRLVIEHPAWIPAAWQKVLGNLRAGEDAGRIYRLAPRGAVARAVPRLDRADGTALLEALGSPSGLVRDLAQQQLLWRREASVGPGLERLAAESPRPETRAQALWTLEGLGLLRPSQVERALRDAHPGVRRQAVRLSEGFVARQDVLLPLVVSLAGDADGALRQQVAYTLGEFPGETAAMALAGVLRREVDPYIRAAAMSSVLPHAATILAGWGREVAADDPLRLELAAVTDNARELASILGAIAAHPSTDESGAAFLSLGRLLDWLQRQGRTLRQLEQKGEPALAGALASVEPVFAAARRVAGAEAAFLPVRLAAVNLLGRGREGQESDVTLLASLLAPRVPGELQLGAVAALARLNRPEVPGLLLAGWKAHGPKLRRAVLDTVVSRPAWAHVLLDQAEKDPELLAAIDSGRREALTQHGVVKLAQRASAVFQAGIDRNRQAVIDRYASAMVALSGRPANGRDVFAAACAACHRFGSVAGGAIGPDLASVKDRSAGYLVTHILDPNRAVEERYKLYTASLQDGREVAGMLVDEAGASVTLRGLDGTEHALLRSEIIVMFSTGRSLMPEGLEGAVSEQAMADLVAYLGGAAGP